ncbi:MAG: DNA repair protein RecO [Pseudomonadota bacterium]
MEWRDDALMLGQRAQGENHSLVTVFTKSRGKASALVYGGQGRGKSPVLQVGNGLDVRWQGKNADALGHFDVDLVAPRAAATFGDPKALAAMAATAELLLHVLPEGEGAPQLYAATEVLFSTFGERDIWPVVLAKWELGLLSALGGGLILDRCVATDELLEDGADLCFVSPKSGGAVTYDAGLPYKDKLFPLPPFLIDRGDPMQQEVRAALELTGHFIGERLLHPIGRELPDARVRLMARL